MIVMGDFNCYEDSRPYGVLIKGESDDTFALTDSYRAIVAEQRPGRSNISRLFAVKPEGSRIDWILHSVDLQTLAAQIDRTHEGRMYPSDHFPVTATLQRVGEKDE